MKSSINLILQSSTIIHFIVVVAAAAAAAAGGLARRRPPPSLLPAACVGYERMASIREGKVQSCIHAVSNPTHRSSRTTAATRAAASADPAPCAAECAQMPLKEQALWIMVVDASGVNTPRCTIKPVLLLDAEIKGSPASSCVLIYI
jgi:hypothetical protein